MEISREKEREKMERAKEFHRGVRTSKEKEREKTFPKESLTMVAKVRINLHINSWIQICAPIFSNLAIVKLNEQSDKAAGGVRQVNETNADSVDDSSTVYNGSSHGASSSNAPASQFHVQNIRAVSRDGKHVPFAQELTAFEQYPCVFSISASSVCVVQHHDVRCADDDDDDDDDFWTYSPFLSASCDFQHVRAIPSTDHGGHVVEKSCWIQVLIQMFRLLIAQTWGGSCSAA